MPVPDDLDWKPVKSSNVAAVAHHEIGYYPFRRLYVKFKSDGAVYAYDAVPRALFDAMLVAPSVGQFIWAVIRAKGTDSVYAYERVA